MENDRSEDDGAPVLDAAMEHFWRFGYGGSSMRDLLTATGSNRAALYTGYGGKAGLFEVCLRAYDARVVSPAFARVEASGAGMDAIASYFEHQIAYAETVGLPGPGCLIANTMTERAPHNASVRAQVSAHLDRLRSGFRHALGNAAAPGTAPETLDALADFLTISAQGLWSHSRQVSDAAPLRAHARTLLTLIEPRLTP
ncbi:MAG: TetR/AcrR family transcriptional regulator [Pseudomonadota bacterium]